MSLATLPVRPILSTLARHKTAAALIVLEIALTCAIVCNAIFLIATRVENMSLLSGAADGEIVTVRLGERGARGADREATTRQDLAVLRALPGVKAAALVNQMPFNRQSSISAVNLAPDQTQPTLEASNYFVGPGALEAFGLRLVAGRDFRAEEYVPSSRLEGPDALPLDAVIVNRRMAERLWPGQDALGREIFVFGSRPLRVVGIVEELVAPHAGRRPSSGFSMLLPVQATWTGGYYILRTEPAARAQVLDAAVKALLAAEPQRLVGERALMTDLRERHFANDRAMVWLLGGVCAALLVVTAFGIVGLASFWVQQRSRMIGIRRALGATRGDILRYFQLENLLLTGIGIALGMMGAYGINAALMTAYELPRLPAVFLPAGAALLLLLGQVAVWAPARRASLVPPMIVMRGA